ncbi:MAG: GlsB/YeaQ/YmgE family stress response membrane protein [Clostridiales bacterium]|nr:GlsB/YeaQ/YmgE family stress response membrane protein [Eubacteriales bacterium]MDH7565271.1 GlsB/YeaQ/YmgE family stress response membrane protein [Clostridiales bacterium]
MLGFIITIIVAALAGWIGDALVKNDMPGGFWGALLAGLVGSWIGAYIPWFNRLGPTISGVAIIPTILGAAIFIFILGLFRKTAHQAR